MGTMKCSFYGVAVVLSSVLSTCVRAAITTHNVDVQEPFISTSPYGSSDPTDNFGWSAIFHRLNTSRGGSFNEILSRTRIIVGAPKGTFPPSLDTDLPAVNQSGLVYDCPIGTTDSCDGLRGNTSEYIGPGLVNITNQFGVVNGRNNLFPQAYSEGRLFDGAPNAQFAFETVNPNGHERAEIKPGQLMGSYLFSSGERIIACASSWVYAAVRGTTPQNLFSLGICYVGRRDLQHFVTASACSRAVGDGISRCLAGISAPIINGQAYIGTAAYSSLSGSVFRRSASAEEASDAFDRFPGPATTPDIYYGFEIASGYFLNNRSSGQNEDIFVGAIRFRAPNNNGAVYYIDGVPGRSPTQLDIGGQMGENFGYSIALVDLNGDGFDELVVGAPTYSNFASENFLVECGRIFIYTNLVTSDVRTTANYSNPMIISGNFTRMRFGHKVVNAGDLNSDGIPDLIVGAPYEPSNTSSSTGAIYVYYGNADLEGAFRNQEPQKIHADDVVKAVDTVSELRSFGFSVSGDEDVDDNNHNDIVVGGYENQVVTMLRTRPFANVQVSFSMVPDVNLDAVPAGFNVTIMASYSSIDPMLVGAREFKFELREIGTPRIFFTQNDPTATVYTGMLSFDVQQMARETVFVFVDAEGDPTQPYQLSFSLVDVDNPSPSKTGKVVQPLSSYPRFRLFGESTVSVNISDLCGGDDCQSDVRVSSASTNITIVAGANPSVEFVVNYANIGQDEARNLMLVITGIPVSIFRVPQVSTGTGTDTSRAECAEGTETDGVRNLTCTLQQRLRTGVSRDATISIPLNNVIGNEPSFTMGVEVIINTTGDNNDTNPNNNAINITFFVDSVSDISVQTRFSQARLEYSTTLMEINTASDLGIPGGLTTTIGNTGPTTIQNSRLTIYFPAREPDITGSNYFLYPEAISSSLGMSSQAAGTTVVCDTQNIDPDCLDNSPNNTNCRSNSNRQKRAGALTMKTKRMRRAVAAEMSRLPRQTTSGGALNCSTNPQACLVFVCNVTKLTTESITVVLDYFVDERFFSSQKSNLNYILTAVAMVEVLDEFQRIGDNNDNDRSDSTVNLSPPAPVEGRGPELYLAIILPAVFGLLVIIVIGILLYCFGFFRRKKKPYEDDELEPLPSKPPPPKEDNEKEKEKEEEITKV